MPYRCLGDYRAGEFSISLTLTLLLRLCRRRRRSISASLSVSPSAKLLSSLLKLLDEEEALAVGVTSQSC